MDLLKAFGGDQARGGVLGAEQVEDLLAIINTGPQLLVNGQTSVGVDEFKAWIKRSKG